MTATVTALDVSIPAGDLAVYIGDGALHGQLVTVDYVHKRPDGDRYDVSPVGSASPFVIGAHRTSLIHPAPRRRQ
jgi:hypothetical protein